MVIRMTSRLIPLFLVLLAGLVPAARATDFCVASADELRSAFSSSRNSRSADTIRIVQGSLPFGAIGFVESTGWTKSLRIEGGYAAGCSSRTSSDPADTVLDGEGLGRFELRVCGELTIDGVTLRGFSAADAAVAITGEDVNCAAGGVLSISHSIVADNSAGSALRIGRLAEARLLNVLVHGNSAGHAALHVSNINALANIDIAHATVAGNSGPGLRIDTVSQQVRVWNTISHGNDGSDLHLDDAATAPFLYHVLGGTQSGSAAAGSTVFTTDPLFVDAAALDFRLASGSPAINAGSPAVMDGVGATDLANQTRWTGSRPDLGAFESAVDDQSVFTVSHAGDSGAGSLRQALLDANAAATPARIVFALSGGCPQVIEPMSLLPAVTGTVQVDGYSQPGAMPASAALQFDASVCVALKSNTMLAARLARGLGVDAGSTDAMLTVRGLGFTDFESAVLLAGGRGHVVAGSRFDGAGAAVAFGGNDFGVRIGADAQRALVGGRSPAARNLLGGAAQAGVLIEGDDNLAMVANNFIGLSANGEHALPNKIGIAVLGTYSHLRHNFIAGNLNDGIVLGGSNTWVHGNWIGLNSQMQPLGNGHSGIHVYGSNNRIGAMTGPRNTIAYNGWAGLWMDVGSSNTAIGNRVFGNDQVGDGWLAIDHAAAGPHANDTDDLDTGPNGLVNHPILTAVTLASFGRYQLGYSLDSTANSSAVISVYAHESCPAGGRGELGLPIATTSVALDAQGDGNGSLLLPPGVPNASFITLTATVNYSTSEPSPCVQAPFFTDNARLAELTLSTGTLSPAFAPNHYAYTTEVPGNVETLTIDALTDDPLAALTIDGTPVDYGQSSPPLPLAIGLNTFNLVVTARDGVTTALTQLVVTRANDAAHLSSLTVSAGTLSPAFDSAESAYSLSLPNAVSSFSLTPTVLYPGATVTVNGVAVASGSASAPVTVPAGQSMITIEITPADNGEHFYYYVAVTRATSTNARLATLAPSDGSLSPGFDPEQSSYTISVPYNIELISFIAGSEDPDAQMRLDGVWLTQGVASHETFLLLGQTRTITLVVTASDQATSRTYTIAVTRQMPTSSYLSTLTLSHGDLNPSFAPKFHFDYEAYVDYEVTEISLTAVAEDDAAVLNLNGTAQAQGQPSAPIALPVGTTTLTLTVSAADGSSQRSYTVAVHRAPSMLATLYLLEPSEGTLSPTFFNRTLSYTVSLPHDTNAISIKAATSYSQATMTIAGQPVASGVWSAPIALAVGVTEVPVVVTAADGSTQATYTVAVTRAASASTSVFSDGFED